MIASALYFPTEFPPHVDDIKRALLTYDRVYLFAPDDRDLMASQHYTGSAFAAMPIGFAGVPVRPLGKIPTYDEQFAKLWEDCKPAIEQESLQLLPSEAQKVDPTGKSSALLLMPAPPKSGINPAFLLQTFRALATNPRVVTGVGRGLESLPPITDETAPHLVLSGLDDQQMVFQIHGVTPPLSLPQPALYDGFAHTDEERMALTRMSIARLAMAVRAIANCEVRDLQPFTTDSGYASVIQQLSANVRDVVDTAAAANENDALLKSAHLLTRLHNLIMAEFLDARALAELSIRDVLKLRSRAWGKANEHRESLRSTLLDIGRRSKTVDQFDAACRAALEKYRDAQGDWSHEARKVVVRVVADLGKATAWTAGTGAIGTEIAKNFVHVGSFEALLLAGAVMLSQTVKERGPELMDLLRQRDQRNKLPGYSLVRTYSPFM